MAYGNASSMKRISPCPPFRYQLMFHLLGWKVTKKHRKPPFHERNIFPMRVSPPRIKSALANLHPNLLPYLHQPRFYLGLDRNMPKLLLAWDCIPSVICSTTSLAAMMIT